jgi:hypothetical protein
LIPPFKFTILSESFFPHPEKIRDVPVRREIIKLNFILVMFYYDMTGIQPFCLK